MGLAQHYRRVSELKQRQVELVHASAFITTVSDWTFPSAVNLFLSQQRVFPSWLLGLLWAHTARVHRDLVVTSIVMGVITWVVTGGLTLNDDFRAAPVKIVSYPSGPAPRWVTMWPLIQPLFFNDPSRDYLCVGSPFPTYVLANFQRFCLLFASMVRR